MALSKNAYIRISSLIENLDSAGLPEGDAERDFIECRGKLITDCGTVSLSYTESREGGEVQCLISKTGGEILVKRCGAVESEMRFALGKPCTALYRVPPFAFDMKIETLRLCCTLDEFGGEVDLLYKVTVGGASKKTKMKITAEIQNESV